MAALWVQTAMKPQHVIHKFDGGSYFDEIRRSMKMLSDDPRTVFLGQSIVYESSAIFRTLCENDGTPIVPMDRRIELPVVEDFQAGLCTGMALQGYVPVCIFPRMDFMLLAANQLVNHLDKIQLVSGYNPKVIIRTTVGASFPFSSGVQQSQDHTAAFRLMLKTVEIIELNSRFDVFKGYQRALSMGGSCIVVERQDLYND